MTAPLAGRAGAMHDRIRDALRLAGFAPTDAAMVTAAHIAAMRPRVHHLADDHDPAFLHPGRTILILLEDIGVNDPAVLAAGALAETIDLGLAAPADAAADPRVAEILGEIPTPELAGDSLLETLLVAPDPARLVALAERLDHLRHLHLRPDLDHARIHADARDAYLPAAERTHPVLARRYRWWCDTFQRRFLHRSAGRG